MRAYPLSLLLQPEVSHFSMLKTLGQFTEGVQRFLERGGIEAAGRR